MTAMTMTSTPASERSPFEALVHLAIRRGVRAAPFGAAAGAILGLIGGDTDNGLTASETALMMAALLGFGLVPALVAAVSVARRVRFSGGATLGRWGAAIGYAGLASLAWGAIGAAVTFGVGSLADLNLDLGGVMTTSVGASAIAGAASGLLVMLASLTDRASSTPADHPG